MQIPRLLQSWDDHENIRRLLVAGLVVLGLVTVGILLSASVIALIIVGSLLVLFTITSYTPVLLGRIVDKIDRREPKPITTQKKIDEILGIKNYDHEREKSKGKEGESYYWQRYG